MEAEPGEESNKRHPAGPPPHPRLQPSSTATPPSARQHPPEPPLETLMPRSASLGATQGAQPQGRPTAFNNMPPWGASPPPRGIPLALRPLNLTTFGNRDSSPRGQPPLVRFASPDEMDALEAAGALSTPFIGSAPRLPEGQDPADPPQTATATITAAAAIAATGPRAAPPESNPELKAPLSSAPSTTPQLVLRPVRSLHGGMSDELPAAAPAGAPHHLRETSPQAPDLHPQSQPYQHPYLAAAPLSADHLRAGFPPSSGQRLESRPWSSELPSGGYHPLYGSASLPVGLGQDPSHSRPAMFQPLLPLAREPGLPRFPPGIDDDYGGGVASGGDGNPLEYDIPLTGLPKEPIEVTVAVRVGLSGGRRARGSGGRQADEDSRSGYMRGPVCGLFNLPRYLAGRDCIHNGSRWMSRSHFEKVGGSKMAKWYRSIRVLPDLEPLGEWLERHGMPVTKGPARRSRKRTADSGDEQGSGHGNDPGEGADATGSPEGGTASQVAMAVPAAGSGPLDAAVPASGGQEATPEAELRIMAQPPRQGGGAGEDKFLQRLFNTLSPPQPRTLQRPLSTDLGEGTTSRAAADALDRSDRGPRLPAGAATGGTALGGGALSYPDDRPSGALPTQASDQPLGSADMDTMRRHMRGPARNTEAGDFGSQPSPRTPATAIVFPRQDPQAQLGRGDLLPSRNEQLLRASSLAAGNFTIGSASPAAAAAAERDAQRDFVEPSYEVRRYPLPRLHPLPPLDSAQHARWHPHPGEGSGPSHLATDNLQPWREANRPRGPDFGEREGESTRSPHREVPLMLGNPPPMRDPPLRRQPYYSEEVPPRLMYYRPRLPQATGGAPFREPSDYDDSMSEYRPEVTFSSRCAPPDPEFQRVQRRRVTPPAADSLQPPVPVFLDYRHQRMDIDNYPSRHRVAPGSAMYSGTGPSNDDEEEDMGWQQQGGRQRAGPESSPRKMPRHGLISYHSSPPSFYPAGPQVGRNTPAGGPPGQQPLAPEQPPAAGQSAATGQQLSRAAWLQDYRDGTEK